MAENDTGGTPEEATFGLDEVLQALSHDLLRAQKRAEKEAFGLYLRDAEVELSFTVEKATTGGGGAEPEGLRCRVQRQR